MLGGHIAHFRIVAYVGVGGTGIVYKAEGEHLHRTASLEVLPMESSSNPERRRRFLREAQAVAAMTHPNIATVFEVGESSGDIYMAMELVPEQTLRGPHSTEIHGFARGAAREAQEYLDAVPIYRTLRMGPSRPNT